MSQCSESNYDSITIFARAAAAHMEALSHEIVCCGLLQPVHTQMYDKTFISDGIAVRPTVARAGRQRFVAMQCRFVAALTTYQ